MIKFLIIGLLTSIGWHIGKIIGLMLDGIAFNNLHKMNWYAILCRKLKTVHHNKKTKVSNEPYKRSRIGFGIDKRSK